MIDLANYLLSNIFAHFFCSPNFSTEYQACGFLGCLTALEVEFIESGHQIKLPLITEGQANSLKWLQAPEGAAKCMAPSVFTHSHSTLKEPVDLEIVQALNVEPEGRCSSTENPCLHGGTCVPEQGGSFSECVCKPGWQGDLCNKGNCYTYHLIYICGSFKVDFS